MLKLRTLAGPVALMFLAGCATTSGPPPRKGPYVSGEIASRAAPFEAFTRRAAEIPPGFADLTDISSALKIGAGYEPRELGPSMVAFAALAALQEQTFGAAVRARSQGREGPAFRKRLAADPAYAMTLPGAAAAAGRANAALDRRGEALSAAGASVKRTSYNVQKQPWSRQRTAAPVAAARLSAVKQAAGYRPAEGDRARLTAAVSEGGRRPGATPLAARAVAVAALTLAADGGAASKLLNDSRSGQCLRWAKLNYHQCLAAAGTPYEDIYCLGVHAMSEPGRCIQEAAEPAKSVRRAGL